jgi:hypothetical protein
VGKKYLGFRVTDNIIRDIDNLREHYPSKNAVIERALEEGLRFLKKDNLRK